MNNYLNDNSQAKQAEANVNITTKNTEESKSGPDNYTQTTELKVIRTNFVKTFRFIVSHLVLALGSLCILHAAYLSGYWRAAHGKRW